MNHLGTKQLETRRLILRRFVTDDAEAMFCNWANDPDVSKFLTWPPHNDEAESKGILEKWIAAYDKVDYYNWAIVLKSFPEPIGSICVVRQRDDINMVHVGYCIGKRWWRQGYTSEALIRLIQFFFDDVGANRIEARHDLNNPNSGLVMKKAGMRYEGTKRQGDINNHGTCDSAEYAILADDYRDKKGGG